MPDVAHERAAAEDLRVEPVAGPELRERRVGHGQLLVRGRHERESGVAGVDDGTRAEIDRERRRACRIDVRHVERAVEAADEGGVGAAGRRDEDEHERDDRETWAADAPKIGPAAHVADLSAADT